MQTQVKSTVGKVFNHRGYRMTVDPVDHRRTIFSRPEAPRGTRVTDEALSEALKLVQRQPGVRNARFTQAGDILVTTKLKRPRSVSKLLEMIEQLKANICRLIINTLIKESRKVRRKVRQATAAGRQKPADYLNDKSRTAPVPVTAAAT